MAPTLKITFPASVYLFAVQAKLIPRPSQITERRQGTGTAYVAELDFTEARSILAAFRDVAQDIRDNKAANRGTGKLEMAKKLERCATRIEAKLSDFNKPEMTPAEETVFVSGSAALPTFHADVRGLANKGKTCKTVADAIAKCKRPVIEPKLDGWRGLCVIRNGVAEMHTGGGKRKGGRLLRAERTLADIFGHMGVTVIDGEVIADDGASGEWGGVQSLMAADPGKHPDTGITYVVFDMLALNGLDMRALPLSERRKKLAAYLGGSELLQSLDGVRLISQFDAPDESIYDAIVDSGYEGAMVKCAEATYRSGTRGHGVFKLKPQETDDYVIVGFTEGGGAFTGMVGAIEYGLPDGTIIGRCSGFTLKERRRMTANPDRYIGLVIEVAYMGRVGGPDSPPRHPQFKRFRYDKSPTEIGS